MTSIMYFHSISHFCQCHIFTLDICFMPCLLPFCISPLLFFLLTFPRVPTDGSPNHCSYPISDPPEMLFLAKYRAHIDWSAVECVTQWPDHPTSCTTDMLQVIHFPHCIHLTCTIYRLYLHLTSAVCACYIFIFAPMQGSQQRNLKRLHIC